MWSTILYNFAFLNNKDIYMRTIRKYMQVGIAGSVLLLLQACGGEEKVTYQDPADPNSGWQLVWFDEFTDNNIDTEKWSWVTDCWGGGNNELQCYTDRPDNSYIDDGKLIIKAKKEYFTGPNYPEGYSEDWDWGITMIENYPRDYTSARLRTKDKGDWKYGRIEIRAKMPPGQGIWPAIWMMPTEEVYGRWPLSGEIDIMEAINLKPNDPSSHIVYGHLHYGYPWPHNQSAKGGELSISDPSENFYTYAIEWGEDKIRWYVDDTHYGTLTSGRWFTSENGIKLSDQHAPFNEKFHLILNVAVGGNWPGYPDASTTFPVQMEVDYVRVFSCPDSPNTLTSCQ
jgi:beta-glucanase (GH16 family)